MTDYIIRVKDVFGHWYNNAYIVNDYDALRVALFYRDTLHYYVQLYKDGKDITGLLDSVTFVSVPKLETP